MRDYTVIQKKAKHCAEQEYCGNCKYIDSVPGVTCLGDKSNVMDDAADAIEELLAVVPKWISVEERLPEESGYTIVYCADGNRRHVTFAKYQKTPKRWELTGARSYWRVLKWMPLPAPPKEG